MIKNLLSYLRSVENSSPSSWFSLLSLALALLFSSFSLTLTRTWEMNFSC
jgi:hypothetical protein